MSAMKASDYEEKDILFSNGVSWQVISNHVGDCIFLWNESKETGVHWFYDEADDIEGFKEKFGIELI